MNLYAIFMLRKMQHNSEFWDDFWSQEILKKIGILSPDRMLIRDRMWISRYSDSGKADYTKVKSWYHSNIVYVQFLLMSHNDFAHFKAAVVLFRCAET